MNVTEKPNRDRRFVLGPAVAGLGVLGLLVLGAAWLSLRGRDAADLGREERTRWSLLAMQAVTALTAAGIALGALALASIILGFYQGPLGRWLAW